MSPNHSSPLLDNAIKAHISSFNEFVSDVMPRLPSLIPPAYFRYYTGRKTGKGTESELEFDVYQLRYDALKVQRPAHTDDTLNPLVFPTECRLSHSTYSGAVTGRLVASKVGKGSGKSIEMEAVLGHVPVMVCSTLCNARPKYYASLTDDVVSSLSGASLPDTSKKMVACKEDADDLGGYFVVNGIEKVIRLVIQPKVNYVTLICRESFATKGPMYSKFAAQMRCLRRDYTTQTVTMHYRTDGAATLRIVINMREYLLPMTLVMRALTDCSDLELFKRLIEPEGSIVSTVDDLETNTSLDGPRSPKTKSTKAEAQSQSQSQSYKSFPAGGVFRADRLVQMFESHFDAYTSNGVVSRRDALDHLGRLFAPVLPEGQFVGPEKGNALSFEELGQILIDRFFFVHVENPGDKLSSLILMFHKLMALVSGMAEPDNPDALYVHDVSMPGQLYGAIFKEAAYDTLNKIGFSIAKKSRMQVEGGLSGVALTSADLNPIYHKVSEISSRLLYFLSTGNLRSNSGLDLLQKSGFVIAADKLNAYRFHSHFASVHRGAFFSEMKTTAVRKLLPESWGFVCPIHTPDGAPCGLLNHLAVNTVVTTQYVSEEDMSEVLSVIYSCGILPMSMPTVASSAGSKVSTPSPYSHVPYGKNLLSVSVDGRVVGKGTEDSLRAAAAALSELRVQRKSSLVMEIVFVDWRAAKLYGMPAGLDVLTGPCRFSRPVYSLRDMDHETGLVGFQSSSSGFQSRGSDSHTDSVCRKDLVSRNRLEFIGPTEQVFLNIAMSLAETMPGLEAKHCPVKTEQGPKKKTSHHESSPRSHASSPRSSQVDCRMLGYVPLTSVSHLETSPRSFLSILALLTPFSCHNQSPRNMYQCQMLKQTMCVPFHNAAFRADNKSFHLNTLQRPIVRTEEFSAAGFEAKPNGCNAVIAVISYTGYDMEDALVINKASADRGFMHGYVLKSKVVDSGSVGESSMGGGGGSGGRGGFSGPKMRFSKPQLLAAKSGLSEESKDAAGSLSGSVIGADGLAVVAAPIDMDAKIACLTPLEGAGAASSSARAHIEKYKDDEPGYIDSVVVATGSQEKWSSVAPECAVVTTKLRIPRNPVVGDKFASRHGQKGVVGFLWPQHDMPFTASGMTPDILFNPHGFPSRMTVGMLIECMAGKAASMHGDSYVDATNFRTYDLKGDKVNAKSNGLKANGNGVKANRTDFSSGQVPAHEYFTEYLRKSGYAHDGTEEMYCGRTGRKMTVEIFTGVVYYQRLRHMVSDKNQVRATGPVDPLTRQPVKGRKRHGGVRFGEMERDSIISHGCAFILRDRLLKCSDGHIERVCERCQSILTHYPKSTGQYGKVIHLCKVCGDQCKPVLMPYVFRFLAVELASMGVSMKLQLERKPDNYIDPDNLANTILPVSYS